jgi:hypothetical protein
MRVILSFPFFSNKFKGFFALRAEQNNRKKKTTVLSETVVRGSTLLQKAAFRPPSLKPVTSVYGSAYYCFSEPAPGGIPTGPIPAPAFSLDRGSLEVFSRRTCSVHGNGAVQFLEFILQY